MFIGLFSAVYAVQDIYEDGIVNKHSPGSDANAYATLLVVKPFSGRNDPERQTKIADYDKRLSRKTKR